MHDDECRCIGKASLSIMVDVVFMSCLFPFCIAHTLDCLYYDVQSREYHYECIEYYNILHCIKCEFEKYPGTH